MRGILLQVQHFLISGQVVIEHSIHPGQSLDELEVPCDLRDQ